MDRDEGHVDNRSITHIYLKVKKVSSHSLYTMWKPYFLKVETLKNSFPIKKQPDVNYEN